ncbi:glycosyltransferase family 2 protein [Fodinisporobacter ferrooxydans]|uniref:Glycosyltransferase family 2 protein n=1 Tax=Fodinisporobacter ferrooxydans TaxID=2901836 RepID=A0ABY4CPA5_9BACL|nr:glycosyltransferase family 2 protein [Alicyclobacillaceae bacterium MYW30-H2]
MRKEVAVIICNWNKKDYVLKCIESVKQSTFTNYDLYVVDNASTDGSAQAIRELYKNDVILIENEVNKGGSGGFNTGIKEALKKDYKYLYLLDNDVFIDSEALQELYRYLENHEEVGVVGSKIYVMDQPDLVQEIGARINWKTFDMELNYYRYIDDGTLPEVVECDYVPACSMLVRAGAVKKAGTIDEEYFLYWDDIDWCYRIQLAGYKIVAYAKSKVWHKGGGKGRNDTFGNYFMWRNRVHFFKKYCSQDQLESFYTVLVEDLNKVTFFCNYKGQFSVAKSILLAVRDGLNLVRRKATEDKVFVKETLPNHFRTVFLNKKHIGIIDCNEIQVLRNVVQSILENHEDVDITLIAKNLEREFLKCQFEDFKIVEYTEAKLDSFDILCQTCEHIAAIRNEMSDEVDVYIDKYLHFVSSNDDRILLENYNNIFKMFKNIYFPILSI